MAEPRRVGIIGLGIMGRRLLGAIQRHPDFLVGASWDPSAESCAKARELAPELEIAETAEAAILTADLVYLACPPAPRKGYAVAAAHAGKPVFLEKPLGVDLEASRTLIAALEAAGVPAAVNFTQAGSPALAEIQRAVEAGETGALLGIDVLVQYAAWPRAWQVEAAWLRLAEEGGFTREVVSHFLFLSARLLGPLKVTWARPSYLEPGLAETHMLARLEAGDGRPVSVLGSVGGARPDRQEVTVLGERRSYRLFDFYELEASDGGAWTSARTPDGDPRTEALQCQLDELAKCLAGKPHALATLAEAFAVQDNIEAVLKGV